MGRPRHHRVVRFLAQSKLQGLNRSRSRRRETPSPAIGFSLSIGKSKNKLQLADSIRKKPCSILRINYPEARILKTVKGMGANPMPFSF
jgi:hypothetical protein